ncbi:MAG: dihydropteroate synthase [Chloroflexota bacterium]
MKTRVSSTTNEVIISGDGPTVLIGERINPAGKKYLGEALKSGNMEVIRREAREQVAAGADILDVNVGMFGVDETDLLPQVVNIVTETVDIPVCIDSNNADAIQAALKVCPGKPLVNSVTGESRSLERVLPLIKEYGCPVVGLLQDDEGLPKSVDRRVAIAHKIVERAEKIGISRENMVIDCLAFAVGAEPNAAKVTIETIRRIKEELGVNITLGASNISFGMPERGIINSSFITMAIAAGATCLIVDAARVRPVILATDLLLGRDKHARRYIADFRKRQQTKESPGQSQ